MTFGLDHWIWVIITSYGATGTMAYAITFAYFQREYPSLAERDYRKDKARGVAFAILGPVGLIVSYYASDFAEHGLKWR